MELLVFAEIFTFTTPAPVVLVLAERHIMQRHHIYDVMCDCVWSYCAKNVSCLNILKLYKIKRLKLLE